MCSSPLAARADDEQRVAGADRRAGPAPRSAQASGSVQVAATGSSPSSGSSSPTSAGLDPHVARRTRPGRAACARNCSHSVSWPARQRAARAARRVVVDRDAVADRHGRHARRRPRRPRRPARGRARRAACARRTSLDVGAAGRAREHAADDLAGPADGLRTSSMTVASSVTVRATLTPLAASDAASPAARTPRSVTSAHTSSAGVTSNAGLRHRRARHGQQRPSAARTSSAPRSSISMSSPVGSPRSTDDDGPAATNGIAGGVRGEREPVGADLVGDVAVGGHAVEAGDDRVDLRRVRIRPGRGGVDDAARARCPSRAAAPTPSAARPAAAAAPRRRARAPARRSASSAITPSPVPRPDAASAPELQCVITRARGPARERRRRAASAPCSGERRARGVVLALDRLGLRARGAGQPDRPGGQRGGAHALDRPGEVARGRPARRAAAPRRARARRATASRATSIASP